METRADVSEDCTLLVGTSGERVQGTLYDVSSRGAGVSVGSDTTHLGSHVTLVLDRRGGARCGAAVRGIGQNGRVHLEFDQQNMDAGFAAAIASLAGSAHAEAA
jgi:PilZ domain